ncbi:unnamed protein product [Meloidogyne enterolobii]|uniref:Uncharacterized protein n=1 Tax=Meloidogyne enterolobii TaxID=390850 RepID=A0ACB0Y120_MELEN
MSESENEESKQQQQKKAPLLTGQLGKSLVDKCRKQLEEMTSPLPSSGRKPPGSARGEGEKEKKFLGMLSYKIDYDFDKSILNVTVLSAENLPAMDLGGTSDPYVKLYLLPDKKKKFQTKVQRKSLNPVPYNEINSQTLVMNVFDFDRFGKHDQIGQVSVPLGKVDLATTIEKTVAIEASPENRLGEVCLALRYVPNKNKLTVVVMECKNLKKMDVLGLSDPYVKIYLMAQNKRLEKKKTTIKMKTLNPYYNESFSYEVSPEKLQRVHLHIIVSDYDRVGSNERIGHVIIGNNASGVGLKHWHDMIATPRRSVAAWHALQPDAD